MAHLNRFYSTMVVVLFCFIFVDGAHAATDLRPFFIDSCGRLLGETLKETEARNLALKNQIQASEVLKRTTIIIPVGPGEPAWKNLLGDLLDLPLETEIILVGTQTAPESFDSRGGRLRWIQAPRGRAIQLNTGAAAAQRPYLWFLHADSRLPLSSIAALSRAVRNGSDALYYFDLRFQNDGPSLMRVNDIGVWIRSRFFHMPFGDQGFFMSASLFRQLGEYKLDAPYGEDHLLVWAAHQNGVPVVNVGHPLFTSARKYQDRGWGRTTAQTMYLTWKQALPQLRRLIEMRWPRP